MIRQCLEDRLAKAESEPDNVAAYIMDPQTDVPEQVVNLRHLLEIARDKCEVKTRQILEIVNLHVGTR